MKRWLMLAAILLLGVAALVWTEHRKSGTRAGPDSLLNLVADTQRELSRVPMRATRLSDAEEIRIGEQLQRSYGVRLEGPADPSNREIQAYVEKVGSWVAARARRKLPYKFHYIPNPQFMNALALPGGHVSIGKGLLLQMATEDELAAVLGHEIEHVDLYHCAERVQIEARTRNLPLGGLLTLPIEVFQAGYGKSQEAEADLEGVRLAVRAGYSPLGAIRSFEAMQRLRKKYVDPPGSPGEEISQVAIETLRGYFRSHPPPEERIARIRQLIAQAGWEKLTEMRTLAIADLLRGGQPDAK